ncbi:RecG-like helicase [Arthrobacter sp. B1I2]|nr:RecG-like helicase [Arthrobacter sp. B1I2]
MNAELDLALERRIGKRSAAVIEKHLGIDTVEGLLNYFPRRYLMRGELTPISELPLNEEVTLIARVLSSSTRHMQARRGTITDVIVSDDDGQQGLRLVGGTDYRGRVPGTLKISFFNGYKAKAELLQGRRALFSGKVTSFKGQLGLTNPDFQLLDDDPFVQGSGDPEKLAAMPIPVYPATAKLPSWRIQKVVGTLLETVDLDSLPDPLPPPVAAREAFLPVADAYRLIHAPETAADWKHARDRFRYQEALVLQSALARRRAQLAAEEATARRPVTDGILAAFDQNLPFTLTAGQAAVGRTLAAELAQAAPMNRLLQGEVGSGKTVVALRAMLQVIDAGGQAALLAPTEVLAAQHYDSIRRTLGVLSGDGLLGGLAGGNGPSVQVTLLTGSMPTAARKQAMLDAASGTAGIIIGTHALLSDNVSFYDLGLIVVDEQHRFGVEQRDALRAKARKPPHLLVMTATPIPRTVAMTVFGDLETSTLDELPKGRAPISTHLVGLAENPGWAGRIWARARGGDRRRPPGVRGLSQDRNRRRRRLQSGGGGASGHGRGGDAGARVRHRRRGPSARRAVAGRGAAGSPPRPAGPGAEDGHHGRVHRQPHQAARLHHRDRGGGGCPQRHLDGHPRRRQVRDFPVAPAARPRGPRWPAGYLPAGHRP